MKSLHGDGEMAAPAVAWGKLTLVSPCLGNSADADVFLYDRAFTVGEGHQFDLCIGDPSLNLLMCELSMEPGSEGGEPMAFLENHGKGAVDVNRKSYQDFDYMQLFEGDTLAFNLSEKQLVYVFHLLPVRKFEAHIGFANGLNFVSPSGSTSQLKAACPPIFDVVDFEDLPVSFDKFPHYLSDTTKRFLITSSYMHLRHKEYARFASGLPVLCPRILLSGPGGSEEYQEMVVKGLTQYFRGKFIPVSSPSSRSSILVQLDQLFEAAAVESKSSPVIIFFKDIGTLVKINIYQSFKSKLETLPENVVAIASSTMKGKDDNKAVLGTMMLVNSLFPNSMKIHGNESLLRDWKQKLDQDAKTRISQLNIECICLALSHNNLHCPDIETLSIKDQTLSNENVEKIIGWALCHHFMHGSVAVFKDEKIVISSSSITYGLNFLKDVEDENKSLKKSLKDVTTDNEYEKRLLGMVIPPGDLGVTFDDIGAVESVKETLKELVMLPLQRPELFNKGQLIKPCKGILLFGPPGTGKTMLAKAVATEASVNFLNISMSDIMSELFGEGERLVKAVFTLAKKLSPSIIFVDEVDSMLGRRNSSTEHEAMRAMKNEFMLNWDGLCTKENERILVLGSTNRPFDLDEAVIRRFPRRLMVGLPDALNREKIIKVILAAEKLGPDVDISAVAKMTEGYSGSDLKNLCVAAALHPIRQFLEKEKQEKALALAEKRPMPPLHTSSDIIRPLRMDDFNYAHEQGSATVADVAELQLWNERYGDCGSRKKLPPSWPISYFI